MINAKEYVDETIIDGDNRTIEQRLASVGFGHRASRLDSNREVYHLASGSVMGQMDALQALEFLNAQ